MRQLNNFVIATLLLLSPIFVESKVTPSPYTFRDINGTWVSSTSTGLYYYHLIIKDNNAYLTVIFGAKDEITKYTLSLEKFKYGELVFKETQISAGTNVPIMLEGRINAAALNLSCFQTRRGWRNDLSFVLLSTLKMRLAEFEKVVE